VGGLDTGLLGKRAFVTGASRGIGAAIAKAFHEAGCEVVAGYRTNPDVPVGEPFHCDHAEPRLPEGRIDVLVNNAGVWYETPFLEDGDGDAFRAGWREMVDTNLLAVAEFCRQFARRAEPGAGVVNVSSRASHRGEARYAAYAATKAAVNALTKSLAVELGPRGVRVNAVAPGWVRTEMTAHVLPDDALPEPIPLGRVATPEDVAGPVLFLASRLAGFVTGTILDVNGGAYLH